MDYRKYFSKFCKFTTLVTGWTMELKLLGYFKHTVTGLNNYSL